MTLKDVVELVMAPAHTDETVGYMESKISEHCSRYLKTFSAEKLKPKHRFLEHYPWLTTAFGHLLITGLCALKPNTDSLKGL